jgi:hypothetical protein
MPLPGGLQAWHCTSLEQSTDEEDCSPKWTVVLPVAGKEPRAKQLNPEVADVWSDAGSYPSDLRRSVSKYIFRRALALHATNHGDDVDRSEPMCWGGRHADAVAGPMYIGRCTGAELEAGLTDPLQSSSKALTGYRDACLTGDSSETWLYAGNNGTWGRLWWAGIAASCVSGVDLVGVVDRWAVDMNIIDVVAIPVLRRVAWAGVVNVPDPDHPGRHCQVNPVWSAAAGRRRWRNETAAQSAPSPPRSG